MSTQADNASPTVMSAQTAALFREADYTFSAEVCELLDCGFLNNFAGGPGQEAGFCLGRSPRFDVGELGFCATPRFGVLSDLEAYCRSQIEVLRSTAARRNVDKAAS